MQKGGLVCSLEFQPEYELCVNGRKICIYRADWRYRERKGETWSDIIVEDRKSEPTKTPGYRLKKKLMSAIYGIDIRET